MILKLSEAIKPETYSLKLTKSACGFVSKANRPTQAEFHCQYCHFQTNADCTASDVIIKRFGGHQLTALCYSAFCQSNLILWYFPVRVVSPAADVLFPWSIWGSSRSHFLIFKTRSDAQDHGLKRAGSWQKNVINLGKPVIFVTKKCHEPWKSAIFMTKKCHGLIICPMPSLHVV